MRPDARIAVFDNDGTLWCEKPMPVQADFLLGKVAEQARKDASLRDRQPWKAAYERDHDWFDGVITRHYEGDDSGLKQMAAGLLAAYAGEEVEKFASAAEGFLRTGRNGLLKRPHLETAYRPMRELLDFLAANGFANYIVSGGGRDFMRTVTQELYGIPPERVVGTTVVLEYRVENGKGGIHHTEKLEFFDDGPAKPVRIWSRIGARPIFAAGNSNGDLQMLEFSTQGPHPSFGLLVRHDDDEREVAYTAGAEKVLEAAKARDWVVASMKNDWACIFPD